MPYVNIKIAGSADAEKKSELIKRVTETVSEVLDKNPSATYVVIDEVDTDNFGVGGKSITNIRRGK